MISKLNNIGSKVLYYTTLAFLLMMVPMFSFGDTVNFDYLEDGLEDVGGLIVLAVPVLVALALLLFIWGLVVFIAQADDEQGRASGKQKMIWGIIALFVIVSVWGLVNLLQQLTGVKAGAVVAPNTIF